MELTRFEEKELGWLFQGKRARKEERAIVCDNKSQNSRMRLYTNLTAHQCAAAHRQQGPVSSRLARKSLSELHF
jgi:hypothetical protein